MKRPYIASIGLTATMLLAVGSVATATYRRGPSADPTAHSASVCDTNHTGHSISKPAMNTEAEAKASLPAVRLTAQVQYSFVCQTYAGPVCGMAVAIPVGAACWCPSVYGPLTGYAR